MKQLTSQQIVKIGAIAYQVYGILSYMATNAELKIKTIDLRYITSYSYPSIKHALEVLHAEGFIIWHRQGHYNLIHIK